MSHRTKRQKQAFLLEILHHVRKSAVFFSEQIFRRHTAVIKKDFRGVLGMKSDFFQVPAPGKTWRITWNEQKADAVMGSFGIRGADRNNEEIGQLSVTDEDLGLLCTP